MIRHLSAALLLTFATFGAGVPALGQSHCCRAGAQVSGPHAALEGRVQDISSAAGCPGLGCGLLSIEVKSKDGEDVRVYAAPEWFLREKGMNFALGDDITASGHYVSESDHSALLASDLAKGGKTVNLRDDAGRPKWRGRARGAAH